MLIPVKCNLKNGGGIACCCSAVLQRSVYIRRLKDKETKSSAMVTTLSGAIIDPSDLSLGQRSAPRQGSGGVNQGEGGWAWDNPLSELAESYRREGPAALTVNNVGGAVGKVATAAAGFAADIFSTVPPPSSSSKQAAAQQQVKGSRGRGGSKDQQDKTLQRRADGVVMSLLSVASAFTSSVFSGW